MDVSRSRDDRERRKRSAGGEGGGDLAEDKAIRLIWITRFLPMPAA